MTSDTDSFITLQVQQRHSNVYIVQQYICGRSLLRYSAFSGQTFLPIYLSLTLPKLLTCLSPVLLLYSPFSVLYFLCFLSVFCFGSQGLYKAKAAKDTAAVAALVDEGLARAGRPTGSVPKEETEVFCKNARKLLVRPARARCCCC